MAEPSSLAPVLIGISTYGRSADNRYTLPAEYLEALRRSGVVPLLLPPGEPNWQVLVERVDGVVLSGGGDIAAAHYGGRGHPSNYHVDAERDESEIMLARHLLERDLPTLAICRGAQILNVALGGTLVEHIPDHYGESVLHRAPPRVPVAHQVSLDASSRLYAILGVSRFEVASWHHQSIDRLAAPIRAVAHADDGVIEAVEVEGHPWFIGVQWHPELTAAVDPLQQQLFDALAAAARARAAGDEVEA